MVARRGLRPSKLDYARRSAMQSVQASVTRIAGGGAGRTVVGVLLAIEQSPSWRAHVQVHGGNVWLPADPGAYDPPPSGVYVLVDGSGRPMRVLGPTGTGLPDVSPPGGEPVIIQPDLSIDPEARARNEQVAEGLERAREHLSSARDLIEAIRERTGRKAWVGETFTSPGGTFTWTPLGGGVIRFDAVVEGDDHNWSLGGGSMSERTVEYPFPAAGDHFVALEVTVPDFSYEEMFLTVTPEMMDPDYGWVDMTFPDVALDDLMAPGGPLAPDVIAALWEQVVAAGFLVATEAIIGPAAIIDGGVHARHLDVVHELPNGARLSIQPDGIRMWRAGNLGGPGNLLITSRDGFYILNDAGQPLLWIDPTTGNINTAGMVLSESALSAPTITGGTVTGATLRTNASGRRWEMSASLTHWLRAWAGITGEQPGGIETYIDDVTGAVGGIRIASPVSPTSNGGGAAVLIESADNSGFYPPTVRLAAEEVQVNGGMRFGAVGTETGNVNDGNRFAAYTTSKSGSRGSTQGAGTISEAMVRGRTSPVDVVGESLRIRDAGLYTISRRVNSSVSGNQSYIEIRTNQTYRAPLISQYSVVDTGPVWLAGGQVVDFPTMVPGTGNLTITGNITVLRHE